MFNKEKFFFACIFQYWIFFNFHETYLNRTQVAERKNIHIDEYYSYE